MAPIYKGDKEVMPGELKLGNQDVKEVYLGTEKIWPPKPKSIVIYEHSVSPTPIPLSSDGLFDFGNGYRLYWVCGWTHNNPSLADPVYGLKKTSYFTDTTDPFGVVYVVGGKSMPITYNNSSVTPLVNVNDPNLPNGHKELFDTKQVKGFKITVHKWHDMNSGGNTSGVEIYNRFQNATGDINQRYNNGTGSGGRADGVILTPVGELNIGDQGRQADWNQLNNVSRRPFASSYQPMDPNVNKPGGEKNQGWFCEIKKVELVL